MAGTVLAIRVMLIALLGVSSLSKVAGKGAFARFAAWVSALPLPLTGRSALIAAAFPLAEAAALVLLAIPATVRVGLLCSALLLLVFATGTTFIVRKKANVPCMCFGSSQTPMTAWHAIRDWLLCAVAAVGAGLAVPPPDGTGRVLTGVGAGLVLAMLVLFAEDLTVLWASPKPGRPGAPNGGRP
jgi:methylamine utilization protein MauE